MAPSFRRARAVVTAATLLVLVALPAASQEQDPTTDAEGLARFVYSGGAAEGVRKVTQDAPSTTLSKVLFVNLPGASTSWFVPALDSDLLNVGFTAECRLIRAVGASLPTEWVEIRAELRRVPALAGFPTFMEPYDTVSPMAFCDANSYAMHHANWAARVSGGTTGATYTVQIQYKVTGPTAGIRAWLDDWKLELEAHN
jgi:hypothetical protein